MKLKKIKFLTNQQNIFLILVVIFIIFIFNISFDAKKKLEGLSGNFLILNKLQPYNYISSSLLKSRDITKVLEDNAFFTIQKMIEKRVHLLSLKNCKFKKKSDLVTKIDLVIEKNLGNISVRYLISPVEDVLKCKESIYETIVIKLKTLIDNELEKYNNELRYIELLENNELKKYTSELLKIDILENNELLKIELLQNMEQQGLKDELRKIELLEKNELKKYNKELLKIELLEANIDKMLDVKGNREKLTILQKFQLDERLFELKNRKNRLNNMIEILSDKENTVFLDEKLFELKNKKNRLKNMIEILSDKENTVFLNEKLFELKHKKIRLNNVIEILSDKRNIVSDDLSSAYEFEARNINYRFIGNTLIVILLIFLYLLILLIKNKKII